jgi:hypothetical protein
MTKDKALRAIEIGQPVKWRSEKAHDAICEAAEGIANRYCDEDDTYFPEVERLKVAIAEAVDRADLPRATAEAESTVEAALKDLFDLFEQNSQGQWCFKSLSRDASKLDNIMSRLMKGDR